MEKQIGKELAAKIQELQLIEQNLQNMIMQKQTLQFELSETSEALEELNNAKGEVYKVVGQIMIKSEKDDLKKDLESKKEVSDLRVKNLEKQENSIKERLTKLRDEVMGELK
ncbi:prefoldin subunit beta [Nanoarchaeota archaeon]